MWDGSSSTNVTSYVLYYGTVSGSYTLSTNVGNNLVCTITNKQLAGKTWFFVVTARDDMYGLESDPSNEVSCLVPPLPTAPGNLKTTTLTAKVESSPYPLGPWSEIYIMTTNLSIRMDATEFYRSKIAINK